MPILKCKMCGGDLNLIEGDTVCTCEYCGTTQTIPMADSDKKIRLFNRANEYRLNNDFSRAYSAYEAIVNDDPEEAEAYWGMVLSEYGVEYVDDPKTKKKIPTCHRTSLKSVLSDKNYLKALELADIENKMIYEDEAAELDKLQKTILNVSSKERPYDVFISYKENDSEGNRTIDSVIAQDLYDELTDKGLRVFFSRISLEDKFGQNYEPFIFNALKSAKAMLLVVTNSENCNATWVKNEWSRYLEFIKDDPSKSLIPVIKDMSPYELPDELQKLQVLDLNKIGSRQDLIRGVLKITGHLQKRNDAAASPSSVNTDTLLKRAFIFLEDKNFQSADEYFDRVLDNDPENGEAYLGKLLIENKLSNLDELIQRYKGLFSEEKYETKTASEEDIKHINDAVNKYTIPNYLSKENIKNQYNFDRSYRSLLQCRVDQKQQIKDKLDNDRSISRLLTYAQTSVKEKFNEIYTAYDKRIEQAKADDETKACEIKDKYDSFLKDADISVEKMYLKASEKRESDYQACINETDRIVSIIHAKNLIAKLKGFGNYKDTNAYIDICNKKIDEFNETNKKKKEIAAKKRKKNFLIFSVAAIVLAVLGIVYTTFLAPLMKYNRAVSLFEKGDYVSAYPLFNELGDYKDSAAYKESAYSDYLKDSLGKYSIGETLTFGTYEQDNNTSTVKEDIEWIVLDKEKDRMLVISKYALDCQQFNSSSTPVNWETSSLRQWLNSTFYDDAFSEIEKQFISMAKVTADENPDYSFDQGNETQDKVFLLSIDEANKYFYADFSRRCKATDYAYSLGAYKNSDNGNCWWWLRTLGSSSSRAAFVNAFGYFSNSGNNVENSFGAIRPAVWIDIKSLDKY